jgi:hypothetical protein
MGLLDRCLNDYHTTDYERFVEAQIVHEPVSIYLLHELADDVHQRCLVLRQQYHELGDAHSAQKVLLAEAMYEMVSDWAVALTLAVSPHTVDTPASEHFVQTAHNWSNRL